MAGASHSGPWVRRHWLLTTSLGVVLLGGIAAHLYLHSFLIKYVNRKLDEIPGYHAHLKDIGLHLYRGAYSIEELEVLKNKGEVPVPFFKAKNIDISIQWKQLFHWNLVAKVAFDHPQVNLVTTPQRDKAQEQMGMKGNWRTQVKSLIPFRLNFVQIQEGSIHFRDFQSDPPMDIFIHQLNVIAENLTNSRRLSETLAATVTGSGLLMDDGSLHFESTANPYEKEPTFKYTLKLEHLSLTQLNTLFKKYGAIVVKDGSFSLYSEGAGQKGEIKGYAKPIMDNLHTVSLKPEKKSAGEVMKGLLIEWMISLLKNDSKDRLGTRLEFKGRYDNLEVNPWIAIASSLQNAFLHAISASLDHALNLNDRNTVQIQKVNR